MERANVEVRTKFTIKCTRNERLTLDEVLEVGSPVGMGSMIGGCGWERQKKAR